MKYNNNDDDYSFIFINTSIKILSKGSTGDWTERAKTIVDLDVVLIFYMDKNVYFKD